MRSSASARVSVALLAVALVAAPVVPSCKGSSDAEPDASFSDGPAVLSDGVEVSVAGGSLVLRKGGRAVLSLSGKTGPLARSFDLSWEGQTGIPVFSRDNEQVFATTRVVGHAKSGDSVVVRYQGDAGVGATLTVSPYKPGMSRLKLEVTGVAKAGSIALPLACDGEATFYGLGEQYDAAEHRGEAFSLFVTEQGIRRDPAKPPGGLNGDRHTTYFPMPYVVDARGFGLLLKTSRRSLVDLCKSDPDVAWLEAESGEPLEAVVFHGPKPLDVVRQLGDEVGRPKPPPAWAFDKLWVIAQGGTDAVLAEAKALEDAAVPTGVLWIQDWTGKRKNLDGGYGVQYRWESDPDLYPDLPGLIAGLKKRGYRVLGYANPFIDPTLQHFKPMADAGLLIKKNGAPYQHLAPNGAASHPDFTNPAAREYVKGYFRKMVQEIGFDGWMEDFGEWPPLDAEYADGGDPIDRHQQYPVAYHSLSDEVMAEVRPDGDYVIFNRSGYTGVQGHSQTYWVGDQEATFSPHDGLPTVVPGMLSLGLSGVPHVTHDIAGFSGGPSTKELFLRWVELGAFTPIMRTHDGNKRELNWSWKKDDETIAHVRRFAKIHALLAAEIKVASDEASKSGAPVVRHLMLEFPDDAGSRGVHDQYLLGGSVLVAPVVVEGQTRRKVYLPPGAWFHAWTGQRFDGGQSIEIDAPIGQPPVFTREKDRPELRSQ